MSKTEVRHDPFARAGLIRESHINYHETDQCYWCGQKPHILFTYIGSDDRITLSQPWRAKKFCNLTCHDSYYGE